MTTHGALRDAEVRADLGQRQPRQIHLSGTHCLFAGEALIADPDPRPAEMLHHDRPVEIVLFSDVSGSPTRLVLAPQKQDEPWSVRGWSFLN